MQPTLKGRGLHEGMYDYEKVVVIGGHLRGCPAQVINKMQGSSLGWEEAESQEEHRSRCNHIDIAYFWIG